MTQRTTTAENLQETPPKQDFPFNRVTPESATTAIANEVAPAFTSSESRKRPRDNTANNRTFPSSQEADLTTTVDDEQLRRARLAFLLDAFADTSNKTGSDASFNIKQLRTNRRPGDRIEIEEILARYEAEARTNLQDQNRNGAWPNPNSKQFAFGVDDRHSMHQKSNISDQTSNDGLHTVRHGHPAEHSTTMEHSTRSISGSRDAAWTHSDLAREEVSSNFQACWSSEKISCKSTPTHSSRQHNTACPQSSQRRRHVDASHFGQTSGSLPHGNRDGGQHTSKHASCDICHLTHWSGSCDPDDGDPSRSAAASEFVHPKINSRWRGSQSSCNVHKASSHTYDIDALIAKYSPPFHKP